MKRALKVMASEMASAILTLIFRGQAFFRNAVKKEGIDQPFVFETT
jgi:hypothetical protein